MSETHDRIPARSLVIGVDAGGTRSRACLAGADGTVLGRGTGGPGNALSVGRADLTRHLTEAVAGALRQTPGAANRVAAVFGGFAGAAQGLGPERGHGLALSCLRGALAANGITEAAVAVGVDTEVALAAAPGAPRDGLVLIAGTGAIAARLAGGRLAHVVDGYGWLLGDAGSGYWLGAHAVRAALAALDGSGAWTALVAEVTAHYLPEAGGRAPGPGDPLDARHDLAETIVARAYAQAPAQLALLSPAAVGAAAAGDAVALRLLDRAADLLADTVRALWPRPGEPLAATGGLLAPDGPLLSRVTARLDGLDLHIFPVADGTAGAAALARALLRTPA
ncbi:N-acetylglucosamine kinase [Actinacidiphila bryophytorum]|uniref:BadF-type ATPase n=1 Tax=Actinacidiphila bryophytorum TaxID=1436133 RepID=A0A9W4E8P7_9ACTN|nr:BadF/BadG/BcrA/BcrD ATPase family protein [Actinacidiphila bryophytorum]MBM9438061.1 ATPase [Actinacidiphila bryophytorum]MBN6543374.1 ATPase [Actinacidiphila bryophytorum]CAG7618410.1 BadF-type ATPase [Actinacidiphila bryophytorum]